MSDLTVQHGHAAIKQGSKSFALASRIFEPDMRGDVAMLYAWCRHCDDVIDGQVMGHGQIEDYKSGQMQRLEALTLQTKNALSGQTSKDPIFQGLARVFETHSIPHKHAYELLHGFRMDAEDRVYETRENILEYCYHVAGVVGVMMAHVMGVRDAATLDRASDLGLAFQLTNISRDVIDDAKADRVYVPTDLLREADAPTAPDHIAYKGNWPEVHAAATQLLDMAEDYYASARVGIKELPFRCAWAISAALKVYREIGEKLRTGGPNAWEQRVSTSKSRKIWLAMSGIAPAARRNNVELTERGDLFKRP